MPCLPLLSLIFSSNLSAQFVAYDDSTFYFENFERPWISNYYNRFEPGDRIELTPAQCAAKLYSTLECIRDARINKYIFGFASTFAGGLTALSVIPTVGSGGTFSFGTVALAGLTASTYIGMEYHKDLESDCKRERDNIERICAALSME